MPARFDLVVADRAIRVNDLALQVRGLDDVVIRQHQLADAGRGEIHRGRRTEPADTHDQCARIEDRLLPFFAELFETNLSAVTIAFRLIHPPPLWKYW